MKLHGKVEIGKRMRGGLLRLCFSKNERGIVWKESEMRKIIEMRIFRQIQ